MKRPTEKLLREMTYEELSKEAEWHAAEASKLLKEVDDLRTTAVGGDEEESGEILHRAASKDAEAEAHIHQSNVLSSLMYARLNVQGIGRAGTSAK